MWLPVFLAVLCGAHTPTNLPRLIILTRSHLALASLSPKRPLGKRRVVHFKRVTSLCERFVGVAPLLRLLCAARVPVTRTPALFIMLRVEATRNALLVARPTALGIIIGVAPRNTLFGRIVAEFGMLRRFLVVVLVGGVHLGCLHLLRVHGSALSTPPCIFPVVTHRPRERPLVAPGVIIVTSTHTPALNITARTTPHGLTPSGF
mmetsp:Transcript_7946/g.12625  ORF Transcript_7946/g.12625 Transcript_7946/m.12625 type:complete len:205 (+) Transcript_7946:1056-1670(+)